ncbi:gamma-glutamyltransferase [Granulosicoccaceae sp. 1_MG-2023]|nr:gamma-glutamyltransferase [Granulosicoccaceae sp. 1_MG-2023]
MKHTVLTLLCLLSLSLPAQSREARYPEFTSGRIPQQLASAEKHMVASANPYATEAGLAILRRGGSAVDAAIAVQLVLNLVEPESSGIGGGGFALLWDAGKQQLSTIDGREKAPMQAGESLFIENGETMNWWEALAGGRSVGTPGVPAMLWEMHQKGGKLPWAALFEPAISLAEDGFEISPKLAHSIANNTNPALGRYDAAWDYFFPGGQALKKGRVVKNPAFADTLRRLAQLGPAAFYKGQIAMDIVDTVRGARDNPGLLSEADLAAYKAVERPPVCAPWRQFRICGMGPPTSGGVTVIQIMKLLEELDYARLTPMSAEFTHWFTQASRLAYADRDRYLADSDFVDVPVEGLLDESYLAGRRKLMREQDTGPLSAGQPPGAETALLDAYSPEPAGTTHFSIIDADGNAVSMTSSIEMAFGSTLMVRGFLLNNQLTDFSFAPTDQDGQKVANRVEPGKRPRSSMSPMMVFNDQGELYMLIGSPGGSRIIGYVARTLLATLGFGLDIQQAIDLPHVVNRNGSTDLEAGTAAESLADALRERGHEVSIRDLNSGLHGIVILDHLLTGGADPRRVGEARGD